MSALIFGDEATIMGRVAAGAAWLDARVPHWVEMINLEKLDISEGSRCVIGQVYGSYTDAIKLLMTDDEAVERGFLTPSLRNMERMDNYYEYITARWAELVEARQETQEPEVKLAA